MSFAFTGNLHRLFLASGLHGQAANADAINLVNLAATNVRLHLDLYTSSTFPAVFPTSTLPGTVATTAALQAVSGLSIYNGSGYADKEITGVLTVTANTTTHQVTMTPAVTDYNWTVPVLGAPTGGFIWLRYLIVSFTTDAGTGAGTKRPLFAYDGGDVNGKSVAAGGEINVSLPLVLAVGAIGV